MKKTAIALLGSVFCLSGCAVTSFAPPQVRMDREVIADNNQTSFDAVCSPNNSNDNARIDRNTDGALLLINNYVLTYRCQADRAAEGRQFFEVPGALTALGAATAAAFGAGPGVAIGAGAAGVGFSKGQSYYDPKGKAVVFNDGLDAMLCIKNEAVGIDGYTLEAISDLQGSTGGAAKPNPAPTVAGADVHAAHDGDDEPSVTVTSERQYFDMVQSALINVERVVARRLSSAGTPFDMDGIVAEIETAAAKVKKAEDEAGTPETQGQAVLDSPTTSGDQTGTQRQGATQAKAKLTALGARNVGTTVIKLRTLQPRLQQCIVRAKA